MSEGQSVVYRGRRGTIARLLPFGRAWVRWDSDDEFEYVMRLADLVAIP